MMSHINLEHEVEKCREMFEAHGLCMEDYLEANQLEDILYWPILFRNALLSTVPNEKDWGHNTYWSVDVRYVARDNPCYLQEGLTADECFKLSGNI